MVGVAGAGVFDVDGPAAEVEIDGHHLVVGGPDGGDGPIDGLGVGAVFQRVGADLADPSRQGRGDGGRPVADRPGKPGRAQNVVEVVVSEDHVGDRTAGDHRDILGDAGRFEKCCATVDEEYPRTPLHHADGDVEERQPAAVYARGQRLPVVVHLTETSR